MLFQVSVKRVKYQISKLNESGELMNENIQSNLNNKFHITFTDLLKKSEPSRIVIVASELYRLASLNLDNLNPTSSFFPAYLYYVSKYANIVFTLELARRLELTGVTANCLHPGLIDSGIWRNVAAPLSWGLRLIIWGEPMLLSMKYGVFLCIT